MIVADASKSRVNVDAVFDLEFHPATIAATSANRLLGMSIE
jgi:hypothetical protein